MGFLHNISSKQELSLRSDLHIIRKLWHIGVGSIILFIYIRSNIEGRLMSYFLIALASLGFLMDFVRLRNESFNDMVLFVMGPFMRESEKTSYSGLPYYALGASLSLFLFDEKIALLSICFLILSDPISSFFGILYGKDKILKNKSLQGSFAGFCTCFIVTILFGFIYAKFNLALILFSFFAGLMGSLSELCSVYIDDNLTIPVVSGLGITILNFLIPIF